MKPRRLGKLILILEGLLIVTWVYLLFQYHPGAEAIDPATVVPPIEDCHSLRLGIEAQLATHHQGSMQVAAPVEDAAPTFGEVFAPDTEETAAPEAEPSHPGEQFAPATAPATVSLANSLGSFDQPRSGSQPSQQPTAEAVPYCPYRVSTIISGGARPLAVLVDPATDRSVFVRVGDRIGAWQVTGIGNDGVTLQAGRVSRTVSLSN